MSLTCHDKDTVYIIECPSLNSYRTTFDYYKNSRGIIEVRSIEHGVTLTQVQDMIGFDIKVITESNDPLTRIIKQGPVSVFYTLLQSWNIDGLEQYLKRALPKYLSFMVTRALVYGDSVKDIQQLKITSAGIYESKSISECNFEDSEDDDEFIREYKRFMREMKRAKAEQKKGKDYYDAPKFSLPDVPVIAPLRSAKMSD